LSHLKERKEKNCLNCNAEVQGKYCHRCGQENLEPKETVWHLLSHFFKDITHFDGNFFSTLKYLFTRPGFLSKEYMAGRRVSYINPVRMYIFTSAFFFLIFFNFFNNPGKDAGSNSIIQDKTIAQIDKMDSVSFANFTREINRQKYKKDTAMTRAEFRQYADSIFKNSDILTSFGIKHKTRAAYDSAWHSGEVKHNWLERLFVHKIFAISEKYKSTGNQFWTAVSNDLMHRLPQMLFLSLPLLALLLKLLYYRRKQFFYVNHAIFSIHLYIFIFIVLLVLFTANSLDTYYLHWNRFGTVYLIFFLGIFFYLYKAMRKFYQQRRAKTILKYILLNLMFLIVMMLLLAGFFLFSFFTI
jgi:hypothetical protein